MKIYFFDYCGNASGFWMRRWFASKSAATRARNRSMREMAYADDGGDEPCGDYGDHGDVAGVDVVFTPQGILKFLNTYAV